MVFTNIMDRLLEYGSWEYTLQSIRRCPYRSDIHIDRSDFFSKKENREYHTVACAADGPNHDGETLHHSSIGYWSDFETEEAANKFTVELFFAIKEITEHEVPIYFSMEDKNAHAAWCMHGSGERPVGVDVMTLLVEDQ